MVRLIAPNGVEVCASDQDAPILMAAGYKKAEPKKPMRKRTVKKE